MFNRLELNDFFINYYYFFWTNFWYLTVFIPIILYIYMYFFETFSSKLSHILWTCLLLLLFIKLVDYWNFINFNFEISLTNKNFNTLLVNSLNKYHPFIFYSAVMYLVVYSKLTFFYENKPCKFIYSSVNISFIKYSRNNLLAISITLFMGSWWALQEGSWGGWWNWDPSEVFGLFIVTHFLYKLHIKSSFFNFSTNNENTIFFFVVIIIFYIFIQLNFDLISHNFNMSNLDIDLVDLFFFNWLTVFTVFLYFIYSLCNMYYLKYWLIIQYNLNLKHLYFKYQKNILKTLVLFLVVVISLISFFFLINNFLLKTFNLNVLNSLSPINYFIGICLVTLLVFYWNVRNFIFFFLLFFIPGNFFLINFLFLSLTLRSVLHIFFFFFLITNVCYNNKTFLFWIYSFYNLSLLKFNDLVDVFSLDVSLNSLVVETKLNYLLNNNLSDVSYNFVKGITSEEQQSIISFFDFNILISLITKNVLFLKFTLFLIDNSVTTLFLLFLVTLVLTNVLFFKKSVIIF